MADGLTLKQEAFAQAYVETGNASEAAVDAGIRLKPSGDGFYVYFLVDGRTDDIFYVGKGSGDRMKHHRRQTKSANGNHVKNARILDCGNALREVVFADGLTEADALRLERSLIKRFRESLTNIASGNVHPMESLIARIDRMIANFLPYHIWIRVASGRQLDSAVNLKGSTEAFHDWLLGLLHEDREFALSHLNAIKAKSSG